MLVTPRFDLADSFVLHAPLELLARKALLAFVDTVRRGEARDRIVELADRFETFGPPVRSPCADEPSSLTGTIADGDH